MTAQAASSLDRSKLLKPSRDDLVDGAFVFGLTVLALIGFRTTFSGSTYLLVGVAGLVLGILVAHIANVRNQPAIVVAAMAIAVFFLLGGALALRAQAAAGILPTVGTTRGLADVGIHGWKELLTTLPPVDSSGPLLAIPYILGLVGGAGGFAAARRSRSAALPALAPLAVLIAVILLGTAKPAAQLLQGAVFGVAALGWIGIRGARTQAPVESGSGRRSRAATAAALIGVTAVAAALLGPSLPGGGTKRVVLRSYVTPPFDMSQFPSPLVGFRKYTDQGTDTRSNNLHDQTLFTVDGLPDGSYIRIATLDAYDGAVWGATSGTLSTGAGQPPDTFERVGTSIDTDAGGPTVTLKVTVAEAYASSTDVNAWLPIAGSATSVQFSGPNRAAHAAQFRYNRSTDQGVVPDRLKDGDVVVVNAHVGPSDVAEAEPIPATALPYGSPNMDAGSYSFTAPQATKWSTGVSGTVPQVLAVAKYLVDHGAYSDGKGDESQYLPGHSLRRLSSDFLNDKQPVGNDEQYAAAFALLSNQLGLPARVVLGAVPQPGGVVQGKDVHAWVEVHLADGGWVSIPRSQFMPPTSVTPTKTLPQSTTSKAASVVPPPNPAKPPSALAQALQDNSLSNHSATAKASSGWQIPGFILATARWIGPPVLIVTAICGLILGLKELRRRRRRRLGTPAMRVSGGWQEAVDYGRDLGVPVPIGQTRREDSAMLADFGVTDLAATADRAVFGPGEPDDDEADGYWQSVDDWRRTTARDLGRWQRWRVALSLRSLIPRKHIGGTAS